MKPLRRLLPLVCLLLALPLQAGETAVRVVSQTVGTDELLLALAEPPQIASLSHLAYEPQFSAVARQARGYAKLERGDAETILKHRPTLVLCADYSRLEMVEQVRRAGVRVLMITRYHTLEDAYANLRLLAAELGGAAPVRAEAIIADCTRRVAALDARLKGVKPVRVIAPSTYGVIAGADTTFADLCAHAGAVNLAETLGGLRGHQPPPVEKMLVWPIDRVVVDGPDDESALAPTCNCRRTSLSPPCGEARRAHRVLHAEQCLAPPGLTAMRCWRGRCTRRSPGEAPGLRRAPRPDDCDGGLCRARAAFTLVGDLRLDPARIWDGLWRRDELASVIIYQIRLPRLLVACLIGAALSSSGLVMQAYFRNSLASPGLLGVSSGAAAGAVVAIGLGWAAGSILTVPALAVAGAFAATGAVVMLARSGASTERLLLAGIALNALLGAVTSYVLSNFTLSYERNAQIIFWLMGGLEDRTWEHVWIAAPIILGVALLWPLGRPMDLLSLGSAEAQSLGVDVRGLRRRMLVLSTVLTALATAVAGAVGFVGLVVPHLLRMVFGPEHRRLVPLSVVGGAVFVMACDLIGRCTGNLRLGIITSLVGGPFFLWLLRKKT